VEELKKISKEIDYIKVHVDSKKIAKLMRKCDFAIITPSVVVHEAIYMQLPFIAIKTVDNQSDMYSYLINKGYICLEKFQSKELKKGIDKILRDIKKIGKS
jgi:spore coat polysaccharide biosynthesis predicted glycosyltransferase SpsG